MVTDFSFKSLFVSILAERNSACQRCILGGEAGKPGPAETAAEQWPSGCGLQRQCMDGHGICMPEHAFALCKREHPVNTLPSHAYALVLVFACSVLPENPGVQWWTWKHAEEVRK